jgi:cell division protease FtsH
MKSNINALSTKTDRASSLDDGSQNADLPELIAAIDREIDSIEAHSEELTTASHAVSKEQKASVEIPDRNKDERNAHMRLAEEIKLGAQTIRAKLDAAVLGQAQAVDMIADAMVRNQLLGSGESHTGPKAVMLFVGPVSTGKGLAAQKLCESLADYKLLTLDLSHISHPSQTGMLVGEDPSFNNATPGTLTTHVSQHPKSVIFFENVDRCHPNVLAMLNGMLATGKMKDLFGIDSKGKPDKDSELATSFHDAILIFSTTAGEDAYGSPEFQSQLRERPAHAEAMILEALAKLPANQSDAKGAKQFTSTLLSFWRGGKTAYFQALNLTVLTQIAQQSVGSYAKKITGRLGCKFNGLDDSTLLQTLLLSLAPQVGAGEASSSVAVDLFAPFLDHLVQHGIPPAEIRFAMSPAAQRHWADLIGSMQAAHSVGDMLDQCRRRGLKLELDWMCSSDARSVTLENLQLTQVKAEADITGPGSIKVEVPRIGFKDIAGHLVIKSRLSEVVALLKKSADQAIRKLTPRGMLLYGPPGTGKTMLAKALAHEVDLPFISTTGAELVDPDLTRLIFSRARRYAPCIIFVDEIDALGSREQGSSHRTMAINQLLAEMDGFDSDMHGMVFVIAATNLPNNIDPALRRAGRLDLHLEVPPLDPQARGFFVDRILKMPAKPDITKAGLVALTAGMSGADMEQLHRELQLACQRLAQATLDTTLLLETINTLRYGQRTTRALTAEYMANTAIHEAGHAVISRILNPALLISHISIVPRSRIAGLVAFDRDSQASHRYTLSAVKDTLCVFMAGREAQEKLLPGSADEGASDDLARATRLALMAVGQWGLLPQFGLLALPEDAPAALQHAASAELLAGVCKLLDEAQNSCQALINDHWHRITALQQRLISEEYILGNDW